MSLRRRLQRAAAGASKCRTVDVCDIFGDGSGVALYRFDGNANDESGNYHGTETNVTYGGGMYERGAVFNGSSVITIPSFPTQPSTSQTYSMFVKTTTVSVQQTLFDSTNRSMIFLDIGGAIVYYAPNANTTFTYVVPVNTTVHIVVVVSGTLASLYINGTFQQTAACTSTTLSGTLYIGRHSNGSLAPFNGMIDQVRIFNRAVTEAEVARLYEECAPTSIIDNVNPFEDDSLRALYQFDGDATDLTGGLPWTISDMIYSDGVFGKQCADFTTVAPNASISSSIITGYSSTGFTLTAWINMNNVISYSRVISTSDAAGQYMLTSILVEAGYVYGQFGLAGGTVVATPTTLLSVKANVWHLIAFRFNADKTMQMSIDAGAYTAKSAASPYSLSQVINNIMLFKSSTTDFNTGKICQIRIFNKALTPMEVASLYCGTTPLEEPLHALVDPFKDGSGKALFRFNGNILNEDPTYTPVGTSIVFNTIGGERCLSSGKVDCGTGSKALMPHDGSYSVTGMVYWDGTTGRKTMLSRMNSALGTGYGDCVYIDSSEGNPITFQKIYAGGGGTAETLYYTPQWTVGWHKIALTFDRAANIAILYFNGIQVATKTNWNTGIHDNNLNCLIGAFHNSVYYGKFKQVRAFNRVLTATEVQTLHTQGA